MANTYKDSNGKRWTQAQIDRKIRKAKEELLENQRLEHGYNFCETCGRNDCKPVTCAHIISIEKSKNSGRVELAWTVSNMIPEGLRCHQKRDGLNVQYSNQKTP